ncbi:MAG: seg [Microgenomates group bacterium GW2011_GWC1_37_12b]|nr:MAG: seg [Microgenomates group bacterium GW2011_GWC1_37_12b]
MQLFTAVLAQINNPSLSNTLTNGTVDGVAFMQRLLVAFIGTLLVVAGVFFVFMILWGGIKWIIAGGDKGLVESARKILTSALIGIIVVFSIYAIVKIVGCRFFGMVVEAQPETLFVLDV